MNRISARALVPALLLPLALTACGTDRSAGPTMRPAGAGQTGRQDTHAGLEARAREIGTTTDLVYALDAPGFDVARQSVGAHGADGFSSVYATVRGDATITLTADRGALTEADCPRVPVYGADGAAVSCERDGGVWYRTAGDFHEYALARNGHVVRLAAGGKAVDRDTLRTAARSAHLADDRELDALLPPLRGAAGTPPERGDLPPTGDSAPRNRPPEGTGG
ncbi:hypothetical protein BLA24_05135 [Streptomyces cinnamoneus]|uniref:Membrane lipoprotein n=1 Tax=Streptomyces cinnamoneus TaxID=53446 RepID=A0A2G1XNY7_STRCJ|nr:hypothetical protein [Streptomyces cinnamoneus]PHQ52936.1 hypothetical protein BLA24_05135 [Streptomyces cinnamoneus]PPT11403.1 hypothetical protein CYQ11_28395 [Streptomyces cinnamoneus]